jgi:outer membrane protein OmpA-like peptidoglycan-associated protein
MLVAASCALGACASAPPRAPAPTPAATAAAPAASRAEQQTAAAAGLAIERQWLDSFFHGTPVTIAQRDDGALRIEVPLEFCFDRGSSAVKPPLAAVLDKLAESLRRRPATQLVLLAPPDARGGLPALALQRAAQLSRHLRDRGVAAARLGAPAVANVAAVQLRIEPATR